ncbi:MAG: DUF975 family protein [Dysgonamonadaceae bacterium]|jgi:uncharacterized membrane protein|nr:DUF975 family protein [Dysgonamonadaceae bacterium]
MLKHNSKLRAEACESLNGKWTTGVVISLIYICCSAACPVLIMPVLKYGLAIACLKSVRGKALKIDDLFDGFGNFFTVLIPMFLMYLYVCLWSLLFFVPGIVKYYSYAMTPYLLHENPALGADTLICKSMKMMKGHKMKLFLLDLSFIGWGLLCVLSLGIGFLWLIPYVQSARSAFYEDLRTATV